VCAGDKIELGNMHPVYPLFKGPLSTEGWLIVTFSEENGIQKNHFTKCTMTRKFSEEKVISGGVIDDLSVERGHSPRSPQKRLLKKF